MNYSEAREFINNASRYGIVLGLDNIKRLCSLLGNPQDKLTVIHIAGTNGKGSTGAFIEAVLQAAGLRVGRFSSPAVFCYREQWTVNGEKISKQRFAEYIGRIKNITDNEPDLHPTPFEIETAAAFMFLNDEKCNISLIEAGMGGSGDATNIIKSSLVSVITPIALDHSRFLGNTVSEIAEAKAGIIKKGSAAVTAPQPEEAMAVIRRASAEKSAPLFIADSKSNYKISLHGEFQRQNAALAAEVCRHVNGVTEQNIVCGLKTAVWPGRFEKICDKPEFIIDGAHNPQAAQALARSLELSFKGRRLIYITGVFSDKDYEKIAEVTAPAAEKIYTVTPPGPRGLDNSVFAQVIRKFNPNAEAVSLDTALKLCLEETDAVIAAFGSLSFLGEIKRRTEDIIRMKKCGNILHNSEFLKLLAQIDEAEKNRIYCRHGIEHLMDVARAGYIINLEKELNLPKEIVYGAALMHDIGRHAQYSGIAEHHIASAETALKILPQCGYTDAETALIADAVREHRSRSGNASALACVIAEADKSTRMCMICKASLTCKWKEDEKNSDLII